MRIILANPPWNENGRFGVRAGSRWPFTSQPEGDGYISYIPFPFFLAYTTSLLKKENKEVRLIDAIAEKIDEQKLIEEIKSYNPELVVIETSTPSFKNDLRIIQNIHLNLPDCQIAICGPHPSVFPDQILREYNFINYILIGEYEYTLLDLVNHLENNLGLQSILGLAYWEDGKIRINNPRSTIDNLDNLPWPEREDVPVYKYNDGFAGLPQPNVQIWTSRGCPFQCIYCLWPQTMYREHRYRKRNPIDVVGEMEYLIKKFNFKAVYFDDDVFNIDRDHVLDICEEIKKRQIKIPWAVMARADLMDEDLLENMAGAGLYAIKYGIESANQNILNFCRKNMNLDKTRQMTIFTKKLGIKIHLTFCLGLPGETKETIQETVKFIQDIQPDSLQFSFAIPFPGAEYFKHAKENDWLLSEDWSDYDGNYKCIIRTQELRSKDLEEIKIALDNNLNL
jgi:radical SAM superfamily enzyme YgiQ (UPF0313 family)